MNKITKIEELVKLLYDYYEHGAETHTIAPYYEDAEIFIKNIGLPVEAQVSDAGERKFTLEETLQLIREEITESFQDDLTAEELKDKIYTIHGFVICALSRKPVSNCGNNHEMRIYMESKQKIFFESDIKTAIGLTLANYGKLGRHPESKDNQLLREKIIEGITPIISNLLEKLGYSEGAVKPGAVAEAKLKKGASLQPMKDFEKEFYYNWTIEAIKDDKELFHKVKHWFGEWCEENISNFSE